MANDVAQSPPRKSLFAFLQGGGEMGRLMREHDWSTSPLGGPAEWPQSLRTVVRLMLTSNHPIFVFWGPEHICFYNDAYSASIGPEKHPKMLGLRGREMWDEIWPVIGPQIDLVMSGKGATWHEDHLIPIIRHGKLDEVYWTYGYSPIDDDDAPGGVGGVLVICTETTGKVLAERALRDSEQRFRAMADSAPSPTWVTNSEGIVFVNRAFCEFSGRRAADLMGAAWTQLIHPDDLPTVASHRVAAWEEGKPYQFEARFRSAEGSWRMMRASSRPRCGPDGEVLGYVGMATDITDIRAAEQALREAGERAEKEAAQRSAILGQLAEGVIVTDVEGKIVFVNEAAKDLHGVAALDVAPSDYSDTYHLFREDGSPYPFEELPLARAVSKGETVVDARWRIRRPDGSEVVAIGSARPILEPGGAQVGSVLTVRDDTQRLAAEEALKKRSEEFQTLADNIPALAWMSFADGHIFWYNRRWYEYTGTSPESQEGWGWESVHDPEWLPRVKSRWKHSLATGRPFEMTFPLRGSDGVFRPFLTRIVPIRDDKGQIIRWFGTNVDVSDQQRNQQALQEETRTLETLNRTGAAIASELDLEKVVQLVTDAGVELTGAQFGAFFYNVIDANGESYTLYTLSGAERADFEGFPMPRNTAVFGPTFEGIGIVRSDDITQDPRYGKNAPYKGMPEGHLPVRSYLAVPVRGRSGDVIGGLFFGHPEPGRFETRHEILMTGIAAQAAIAIDNAQLFRAAQREIENRMKAEQAVRMLNETLESRVAEEVDRRARSEEALQQLQKMETIGQLSGGIAHDFNNLLQVIHGNLSMIQKVTGDGDPKLKRWTNNALLGAERAAALTQRLLAFSRRQPLAPRAVDSNRLIEGMAELLQRTLSEAIGLRTDLQSGLWLAEVDPNQLENAILNLAVNARDAMPDGGLLTIETTNCGLGGDVADCDPELAPGDYVCIAVSDDGTGMDAETIERALEPFFTTKDVGKGTGLGLPMVYGFARQSGGDLRIYSEPGVGTTAKIYLPRHVGPGKHVEESRPQGEVRRGRGETILLCEDDAEVRSFAAETLAQLGYQVIEAIDASEAMAALRESDRIDLLFTDVILPGGVTGPELADQAQAIRPGLKVLYTSGYARTALDRQGRLQPGVELILKPYFLPELASRLRTLLD